MKAFICPACGELCDAKECDDGAGMTEFCGVPSLDIRLYTGSDCCEAELEGANLDLNDEGERQDQEYNRMIENTVDKLFEDW